MAAGGLTTRCTRYVNAFDRSEEKERSNAPCSRAVQRCPSADRADRADILQAPGIPDRGVLISSA